MTELIHGYDGFLFIGDVHSTSRAPARRIDDYAAASLDKLRQSVQIALERNLFAVCLGDLFHRPRENDLTLLTRMMGVLAPLRDRMVVVGGSHDRTETLFTEKDACELLERAGSVRLVDEPGKVCSFDFGGQLVNLWATPAGYNIPDYVDGKGARNIMVTHHDLDFRGPYPGCHTLKEIENCDLLVNGHMHTPAPMVLMGRTACHNPGSITRPSVDLVNHKPVVSVWTPAHRLGLEAVPLVVAGNVFDMTGKEAYAADPKTLKASLPSGLRMSHFAAQLRSTDSMGTTRSTDGSVMVEELQGYFELFDTPDNLKRYLKGLLSEVVEDQAAAAA